jgi:hypothetical protein
MRCKETRIRFPDTLRGGADPDLADHLRSCARCRTETEGLSEAAAEIGVIPEIDVDRMPFSMARRQIAREGTRADRLVRVARMSLGASAAAAVLVAMLLWFGGAPHPIVAFVSEAGADSPLPPEAPIRAREQLRFPSYAEIVLPSVGVMRVRPGTLLSFDDASTVRLEDGEVFLQIHRRPSPGFRVRTDRFVAAVRGTRFGVRPYAVYVVTGGVNVEIGGGERVEALKAGESIQVSHDRTILRTAGLGDLAAWIDAIDPPRLGLAAVQEGSLRVDRRRAVLLRFSNPSRLAALMIAPPEPRAEYLHLSVERADGAGAFPVALTDVKIVRAAYEARLIRIDADSPLELEASLSPEMFADAGGTGARKVRFVYTSGGDGDPRVWKGSVQSEELLIEVSK